MKILLDENLSHKLIPRLRDLFPDITSVRDVGLKANAGRGHMEIYAKQWISRDHHSRPRLCRYSGPAWASSEIIHLENCNFSSFILEQIIRRDAIRITEFLKSDQGLLVLRR